MATSSCFVPSLVFTTKSSSFLSSSVLKASHFRKAYHSSKLRRECNLQQTPVSSLSASIKSLNNSTTGLIACQVRYHDDIPVFNLEGFSRRRTPGWILVACFLAGLWLIRRIVVIRHLHRKYIRKDLPGDIADFYDLRSAAWESVWGEHMHHGLYDIVDGHAIKGLDAQIRTMSELLLMAKTNGASILPGTGGPRILDVGCGIGGASRFLARTFGPESQVHGITLSPVQAARATEINESQQLSKSVSIEVENAHATSFQPNSFDLVWSLESAEHMDDKRQFVGECTRVLRPGAPFVMLAWCIRETDSPFSIAEKFSIRKIMEQYCLPRLAPPSEYQTEMIRAGLTDIHIEDWTDRAAPFWNEVVRSAVFNVKGIAALFKYGWPLLRSAIAARHVMKGIRLGVFRLVAFTGRKPTENEAEIISKVALKC